MLSRKIIFLLAGLMEIVSAVQAQVPHLTGTVRINMAQGLISCDFTLSDLPRLGKDYQVLLNKGFNIKAIRDSAGLVLKYGGFYNGKMRGEGLCYTPQRGDSTYANPGTLRITYTGAFPVYTDTLNFIDFKGLIAFNGKTLRATDQSKWYPVIYDTRNDRLIEQVTYRIIVEGADAKMLFVNGDSPKAGPKAIFESKIPAAPLLFAGNYPIQQTPGAWFLNTKMTAAELSGFEKNIAEMKQFLSAKLNVPYHTKNVFIEHEPVERFQQGRVWGFVNFPVIAFAGTSLGRMVDTRTSALKDSSDYPFIAHEVAHYYFGNVLRPNATLFWFFLESTAEYLAVKTAEAKFGKAWADAHFQKQAKDLAGFKAIPLDQIRNQDEVSGTYRYNYGPLLLRGLEQIVGEKRMYRLLEQCLRADGQLTDYAFFKKRAAEAGITANEWLQFEKTFIRTSNATAAIR
ncbi:M1 family aminopeptidase [Pedobacter sp. SYP-B3415]|uniref:M1 family aminopeptidase n=1 Tax=Pedobacter sp. SYP-B3415 TaxID=2496641 RepID=UPI00101C7761|nr:M1 family aminopeptidase [Pedobacter sp. SYP-B3415]